MGSRQAWPRQWVAVDTEHTLPTKGVVQEYQTWLEDLEWLERQPLPHNTNMASKEQSETLHNQIIISKIHQVQLVPETSPQQLLTKRIEPTKLPPSSSSERKLLRQRSRKPRRSKPSKKPEVESSQAE